MTAPTTAKKTTAPRRYGICTVCRRRFRLTKHGDVSMHQLGKGWGDPRCTGSWKKPLVHLAEIHATQGDAR